MKDWISKALTFEANRRHRSEAFLANARQFTDKLFAEMAADVEELKRQDAAQRVGIEPRIERSGPAEISVLDHDIEVGRVAFGPDAPAVSGVATLVIQRSNSPGSSENVKLEYDATRGGFPKYNLPELSERAFLAILFPDLKH